MSQRFARIVLALTVTAVATAIVINRQRSESVGANRYVDEAGMVAPGWVGRMNRYLDDVMYESGVDVRVLLVSSTRGQPLPAFALARMRAQGVGRDVGGRGLLIVVDDSTKQARIEVGPHLEGIFPDGFVGYLLREQLGSVFDSAGPARATWTTLVLIHERIRQAVLAGEFDSRVITYMKDVRSLARGGGASISLPLPRGLHHLMDAPTDSTLAAYFGPQPSVEDAYQRHLEFLALGLWPRWVPLFLPSAREWMQVTQPGSRGWNDYILMVRYGYSYKIVERGDYAMLYYTGTPFQSPLFFRRGADGWQMDVIAEVRNSQETIGTYYTWRILMDRDRSSAVFADLFDQIDGTGFGQFLRVRGGDNRPLCIHGAPRGSMEYKLHPAKCLADSLWKSHSN